MEVNSGESLNNESKNENECISTSILHRNKIS